MREAIHRLKYGGRLDLAVALARSGSGHPRLAFARGRGVRAARTLVVPVPPRLWTGRTDQAGRLAEALAREWRLPCVPALRRRRGSGPQAGATRERRLRQVRGAFRAEPGWVAGRPVLLVDDVLSTGATADACARALKRARATTVRVVALAT